MIISIIPARGGSKAIPNKNIVPFLGNPLITYTIKQSLDSECVDRTFVSTDDEQIAEVGRSAGADIIERPERLAGDMSSTEDALLHALSEVRPETDPEVVVLLQCTSPLRRENDIDNAIKLVTDGSYNSVLSACEDHKFYWSVEEGKAEPVNYDPKTRKMRQNLENRYQENGSIYVTWTDILEEEECRLGGEIGIHEMPKEMSLEIDTPEDYRIVENVAKSIEFAHKQQ